MTDYPITSPPELVQQWWDGTHGALYEFQAVTTQAAQRGADQELEACCEWVKSKQTYWAHDELRATRRPKPPSLKEQALAQLDLLTQRAYARNFAGFQADTIRLALEALPDD